MKILTYCFFFSNCKQALEENRVHIPHRGNPFQLESVINQRRIQMNNYNAFVSVLLYIKHRNAFHDSMLNKWI